MVVTIFPVMMVVRRRAGVTSYIQIYPCYILDKNLTNIKDICDFDMKDETIL